MDDLTWLICIAIGAALNVFSAGWHIMYYCMHGTLNSTPGQLRTTTAIDAIMVVGLAWAASVAAAAHDGWVLLFALVGMAAAIIDAWFVFLANIKSARQS